MLNAVNLLLCSFSGADDNSREQVNCLKADVDIKGTDLRIEIAISRRNRRQRLVYVLTCASKAD